MILSKYYNSLESMQKAGQGNAVITEIVKKSLRDSLLPVSIPNRKVPKKGTNDVKNQDK